MVNPILVHATRKDFNSKTSTSDRFPSSSHSPFATPIDNPEVNSTIDTVPLCLSEGAPQILQALTEFLISGRQSDSQFNFSFSTADHIRDISVGREAGNRSPGDATVYATTLSDLVSQELQFQGNAMWQRLGIPVKATLQAARYSVKEQAITKSTNSALEALLASNVQWRQPAVAIHFMGL